MREMAITDRTNVTIVAVAAATIITSVVKSLDCWTILVVGVVT